MGSVRSIQYDLAFLSSFCFNKSLPNRRIMRPIGNTVTKYTRAITIGAIIEPSNKPNLNHNLLGPDNVLGASSANNKKIPDTINAHRWKSLELISGYKATIKNTTERFFRTLLSCYIAYFF